MLYELIIGTLSISTLHALIPSHWLPILVFEKKFNWTHAQTMRVTITAALLHALSTVILGVLIGFLSIKFSSVFSQFSNYFSSGILVLLGLIFIVRHHKHNHFHLHNEEQMKSMDSKHIISVLLLGMFLSPCLEIEGYFILAGNLGWKYIILVSLLYILISLLGIIIWMNVAKSVLKKINPHRIEHSAGLVSGIILIMTGAFNFVLH